ncbi:hypothetical protein TVH25_07415 [Rhodococcus sp. 7Tela_A2]
MTKAELLRVAVGQPAVVDGDHVASTFSARQYRTAVLYESALPVPN